MLFNSIQFLIFFPIVVLVYFVVPLKAKRAWLLAASYFFYMCWNVKYIALLLASTLITYGGGLALNALDTHHVETGARSGKRIILGAVVVANLALLFVFKYFDFFFEVITALASALHIQFEAPAFDVLLPVGISFYTFQALGYLVDVYRGDVVAERNVINYALFVSFFPQLVAGPIERSRNLLGQLSNLKGFDYPRVREGLLIMLWGFFLKLVIADRCAVLVNTVYSSYSDYSGIQLVIANCLFAMQIYCDFMGYSIIAKGSARVLGINLMDNFRQPYFAVSIRDFWRRWHISLSTWLRDYLYIPLGGSRCSKTKKYRNLFITFAVSGLWHGASVTYVIWGILHAVYQILGDVAAPLTNRMKRVLKIRTDVFSWRFFMAAKTFVLVDVAWIFFRAESLDAAIQILSSSLQLQNIGILCNGGLFEMGLNEWNIGILAVSLTAVLMMGLLREKGRDVLALVSAQNAAFRYLVYWGAILLIVLSLDIVGQEFIYFQF